MSMLCWTPLEEMDVLKREMESLFAPVSAANGESRAYTFNPPAEVIEAENIGEHVHLEATQKALTISGELNTPVREVNEKVLTSQFRYGRFFKQLGFPDGIDHENIEANYQSGILEIRLPKMATAQKRSIQIQVK
jgi:HSP20 family protein